MSLWTVQAPDYICRVQAASPPPSSDQEINDTDSAVVMDDRNDIFHH
jgi:hypothetical protein